MGNQIRLGAASTLLDMGERASVTFVSNVIDQPSGSLMRLTGAFDRGGATGLADLEECTYVGCVATSGNVLANIALLSDDITVDENLSVSAARENVGDSTVHGAPTFVAGDINGTCRGAPQWTSGPLEL